MVRAINYDDRKRKSIVKSNYNADNTDSNHKEMIQMTIIAKLLF